MSTSARQGLKVGNSDQVIVTIHPDADIDFLLSILEINPIELKIIWLGDGAFNYTAFFPQGIEVRHLAYDTQSDLMPDISLPPYKRLLHDRFPGSGFHLHLRDLTEQNLKALKANPLVLKLNQGNGFLIACPEQWQIHKSEFAKNRYITDPLNVPPVLERLMALLDEPVPHKKQSLELHKKRLALRRGFLGWYMKKSFTPQVDELLRCYAEEVEDELLCVEQLLLEFASRPDSFSEQLLQRWAELMAEQLPADLVSELRQRAMELTTKGLISNKRAVKGLPDAISALEPAAIAELLRDYAAHPGYADLISQLAKPLEQLPIHACTNCGGRAKFTNPVKEPNLFTVLCTSCGDEIPAQNRNGDAIVAILAWNKRNRSAESLKLIKTVFDGQFANVTLEFVIAWHKRVAEACKLIRHDVLDHHRTFKTRTTRALARRQETLGFQLDYLKVLLDTALKEGK